MKNSMLSFAVVLMAFATMTAAQVEERSDLSKADRSSLLSVQEHHNRRMAKLREMIEDRRRLVEDHESGERRLGQEDFDRTARQLRNFQRKLDRMEETNNVESHMERLEEMRSLHDVHRANYIDLKNMLLENGN